MIKHCKVIKELFKKVVFMSVRLVAIIGCIGIAYGFTASRSLTFTYAFRANFWVGVTILISGLFIFFTPTALLVNRTVKKSRIIDHTTYHEKFQEERERKHKRANELIYTGICNITITGFLQFVLWIVKPFSV